MSYKDPGFNDRIASAAKAKQAALDKLKSRPPVDEAAIAAKLAAGAAKEAADAEKRAAKIAQREQEAAEKAERKRIAAEEEAAKIKPALTDAEKKAIRDAKYAARKQRKR